MNLIKSILLSFAWLCHLTEESGQFTEVEDKAGDSNNHDEEDEEQFEGVGLRYISITYRRCGDSRPI